MENFAKVKELIASVEADVVKFYENGNAAAGTRVSGCCTTHILEFGFHSLTLALKHR